MPCVFGSLRINHFKSKKRFKPTNTEVFNLTKKLLYNWAFNHILKNLKLKKTGVKFAKVNNLLCWSLAITFKWKILPEQKTMILELGETQPWISLFFLMLALQRRTSFWPPNMVYISVIITHTHRQSLTLFSL